jgi:glucose-6-phosphate isomerase
VTQTESPGAISEAYRDALGALEREGAIARLLGRDPSLWKREAAHGAVIANRLGWLDSPAWLPERIQELRAFAETIRAEGFTKVLLLGMGGSSLAPEVLSHVLSPAPGAPTLETLDSTDPAAVLAAERAARLDRTFFLVSSKSGRTIETLSQYRYFRARLEAERIEGASRRFAAITDPGSALERLAGAERFRTVFKNPPDIGGRYSALSYFGMVPAAILGLDLVALARHAGAARAECSLPRAEENGAIRLGALMAAAAKGGRDKLTLLLTPELRPLGYWIEQLIAESTGKDGVGIIPVEGEPLGSPRQYGEDRLFVSIGYPLGADPDFDAVRAELKRRGAPWIDLSVGAKDEIAGAFYRWEVATALAGALLEINPFDEPNVQESKDRTAEILAAYERTGGWPEGQSRTRDHGVEVYAPDVLWNEIAHTTPSHPSIEMVLGRFLSPTDPGAYVALLAFIERAAASEASFARMRRTIRDALGAATIQGYGPRYLHSIGQLFKGGPRTGRFVEITASDPIDLSIPESRITFGDLKRAQALGDLASLEARGVPALRLHMSEGTDAGLRVISDSLERALASLVRG